VNPLVHFSPTLLFAPDCRAAPSVPVQPSFLLKPDLTAPMALLQGLRHTDYKECNYCSKGFYFIGSPMLELQTEVTMKIFYLPETPLLIAAKREPLQK